MPAECTYDDRHACFLPVRLTTRRALDGSDSCSRELAEQRRGWRHPQKQLAWREEENMRVHAHERRGADEAWRPAVAGLRVVLRPSVAWASSRARPRWCAPGN